MLPPRHPGRPSAEAARRAGCGSMARSMWLRAILKMLSEEAFDVWVVREFHNFAAGPAREHQHGCKSRDYVRRLAVRTHGGGKVEGQLHRVERLLQLGGGDCTNHAFAFVTYDGGLVDANDGVQASATIPISEIGMRHCGADDLGFVFSVHEFSVRLAFKHRPGSRRAPQDC
jgi:hypothetical protein